jgi:hypothetical protein
VVPQGSWLRSQWSRFSSSPSLPTAGCFVISVGIGIVVAAILYFWRKYVPLKEEEVENKHPLGLD